MKNDKLLVIASFGIISTVPAEFLAYFLVYLGFGKFSIYQLASLLITFNRPTLLIGFIVDALVGSFVALIFYYLLQKLGSAFLIIKVVLLAYSLGLFVNSPSPFSLKVDLCRILI